MENYGLRIMFGPNTHFSFEGKISFENLTLAPIEKDLINFKLLTLSEKNYLFKYHLNVYSNISKYLNLKEKKWLTTFI